MMNQPMCQSCAMPMTAEDYGTNADGSKNEENCKYCYEGGKYTSDCTMDEMIDVCVKHMATPETGMTEAQAREIMSKTLPMLKRWKKA